MEPVGENCIPSVLVPILLLKTCFINCTQYKCIRYYEFCYIIKLILSIEIVNICL